MRRYMSKRQRPCDFCRSRKTACRIENAPPCRSCQLHGRECTFVQEARPRKRPLAEQQPGLDHMVQHQPLIVVEAMHAGGPQNATNTQHHPRLEKPAAVADTALESSPMHPSLSFPDMSMEFLNDLDIAGSEYEFMFRTPRPETVPERDISHAKLDTPGKTSDERENLGMEMLGLSGDMDPYLLRRYRTNQDGIFQFKQLAIHSVQRDSIPAQFLSARPTLFSRNREEAGHSNFDEKEQRTKLDDIVSPDLGSRLIALYQQFIAPQYPIFSNEQLPTTDLAPSYLLAAIYSIAFPFAIHDDQLCIELAYDDPPYAELSDIINLGLYYEVHSPSLTLAQTALLVLVRPSQNPLVSDASYRWSMLGILVAVAVNTGLHMDPSCWRMSHAQISLRRRLSFIIYSTDIWLAASLGRPPFINESNWLVAELRSSDEYDSGLTEEQWADLLPFSSLTAVMASTLAKL